MRWTSSERDRSSTRPLSRRLRRFLRRQQQKESEVTAGTDLRTAQEALQRAQAERARVLAMRPKTEQNAREARKLVHENHFAERIRRSFT